MSKAKPYKEAIMEITFNNKDGRMKAKNVILRYEFEEITINPDLTFNGRFKRVINIESNDKR
jgi:hypothetical protein